MGAIPYVTDAESQWNGLVLGRNAFPGVWSVEGVSERDLEVKPRKGADLARVRDRGYKNTPLMLAGTIANSEEWEIMQPIIREIHPRKKGKDRNALQIVHPGAAYLGVDYVYVQRVHAPRAMPNGIIELRIEVLEWSNTPKKLKKRKGNPERANQAARDAITGVGDLFVDPTSSQLRLNTGIRMPSEDALNFLTNPSSTGLLLVN